MGKKSGKMKKSEDSLVTGLSKKNTGLVYDLRMKDIHNIWLSDHAESPERISVCFERSEVLGLVDRCIRLEPRYATVDEIATIHTRGYIEDIKSSQTADEKTLLNLSVKYSTHFCHDTYNCALLSAGCALNLADAILSRKLDNGMAIIRPPGHHASRDMANGYCFFNNAALVAHTAISTFNLKRILIVDWDTHHGQGTQRIFYNNEHVLFISIHRYEHGNFWPYLRESDFDFIGEGEGLGYNINIPLNKTGLSDSEFITIFQQIVMPVARKFNPELVIVSSGYDSALGDPEGEMTVSPACFAHLTHFLRQLAGGKMCMLLEGGYCLKALAESAALTLRDLLGEPCPLLPDGGIDKCDSSVIETILLLKKELFKYWPNVFDCHDQVVSLPLVSPWDKWVEETNNRRAKTRFIDDRNPPPEFQWDETANSGYQHPDVKAKFEKLLDRLIYVPDSPGSQTHFKLSIVISDGNSMYLHKPPEMEGWHPENPQRIISITDRLREINILSDESTNSGLIHVIKSRLASKEELLSTHTLEHVEEIFSLSQMDEKEAYKWSGKKDSLYACPESLKSALHAVGGLIDAVDEVMTGKSAAAFAPIRPPGHHSDAECPAGFCFFNNIAIAANLARIKFNLKRILIVDWDVHFGDGTSSIFYDDPNILYISLHRYEYGYFYPAKKEGGHRNVGGENAKGFNLNIPWSGATMGANEYIAAFESVVMPVAYQFNPELVFVSAGFDSALGDPLGGYEVTPEAYASMMLYLTSLAGGRVVVALEGGYNLSSICNSTEAVCRSLLGESPSFGTTYQKKPKKLAFETIQQVIEVHSCYWDCLKRFHVSLPVAEVEDDPTGLSDALQDIKLENPTADTDTDTGTDLGIKEEAEVSSVADVDVSSKVEKDFTLEITFSGNDIPPNVAAALGLPETSNEPEPTGFLVEVLLNCSHTADETMNFYQNAASLPVNLTPTSTCEVCSDSNECWVCLACLGVGCGRYRACHGVEHFEKTGHCLAFSLADFSIWCYKCESYVHPKQAGTVYTSMYLKKFGCLPPDAERAVVS